MLLAAVAVDEAVVGGCAGEETAVQQLLSLLLLHRGEWVLGLKNSPKALGSEPWYGVSVATGAETLLVWCVCFLCSVRMLKVRYKNVSTFCAETSFYCFPEIMSKRVESSRRGTPPKSTQ